MPVLFNISLRNLIRQKRRNILLGTAIAFGAMVLVLANSFSHGISKVLFEQIVKYINGHVSVTYTRNGDMMNQIFYDRERVFAAAKKAAPDVLRYDEGVGIFGRALGNGVSDNVAMVGVDLKGKLSAEERKEFEGNFKMLQGSFENLKDKSKGTPVVLSEQKAKYLKVKMGDVLKTRFIGVTNQASSAQLTVVGLFKPANVFMSMPIFLELEDIKKLSGYGPHDVAGLMINMKEPQRQAKKIADRLWAELKPDLAIMQGQGLLKGKTVDMVALGFRTDSASARVMSRGLKLALGDSAQAFNYKGVVLSYGLAKGCGATAGDTIRFSWKGKFDTAGSQVKFPVTAIADSSAKIPANCVLVNEKDFYHAYYAPLPAAVAPAMRATLPDSTHPLWAALAPEFLRVKRCATTEEFTKIYREMGQAKFKGIMVSVQSMYETASAILKVEAALNLITVIAGLVLFFIILIGVINTLRMTIRERTREIGTVRAIGMQKKDVQNMFLTETGLLALFSSIIGTAVAFGAMWGLSALTIDPGDNPMGMLLVKNHLFFAPTVSAIILINIVIVAIALGTAYFPSRRASKISAANAMRHYE
jgi:ABC-type lipoprotein release transport system permease subunit